MSKSQKKLIDRLHNFIRGDMMKQNISDPLFKYLAEDNLTHMSHEELYDFLNKIAQKCPQCQLNNLEYYCIEPNCLRNQLVCPNCSKKTVTHPHFAHQYTYFFPLFMKSISTLEFYKKQSIRQLKIIIEKQISEYQRIILKYKIFMENLSRCDIYVQKLKSSWFDYEKRLIPQFFKEDYKHKKLSQILNNHDFFFHNRVSNIIDAVIEPIKQEIDCRRLSDMKFELITYYNAAVKQNKHITPYCPSNERHSYNFWKGEESEKYLLNNFKEYELMMSIPSNTALDDTMFLLNISKFNHIKQLTLLTNSIYHIIPPSQFINLETFKFYLEPLSKHYNQTVQDGNLINLHFKSNQIKILKLRNLTIRDFVLTQNIFKTKENQVHTLQLHLVTANNQRAVFQEESHCFAKFISMINRSKLRDLDLSISSGLILDYSMKRFITLSLNSLIMEPNNLIKLKIEGCLIDEEKYFDEECNLINSLIYFKNHGDFVDPGYVYMREVIRKRRQLAQMLMNAEKIKLFDRSVVQICLDRVLFGH